MYYNAIIQETVNDGQTQTSKALFDYPDLDSALAAYHSELANRAANRVKTVCVIIDEYGTTVKRDIWQRNAEE